MSFPSPLSLSHSNTVLPTHTLKQFRSVSTNLPKDPVCLELELMAAVDAEKLLTGQITCGSLLQQLQQIWDEVGESDDESDDDRDKMLLQLEQECLDVYKKKVDHAVKSMALIVHTLADARVELTNLLSALGEKSYVGITSGSIKEQLAAIAPALEKLWKQKDERMKEFSDVQSKIQKICAEIAGISGLEESPAVDESDLSLKKLDEFHAQLQLQKEKGKPWSLVRISEFGYTRVHATKKELKVEYVNSNTRKVEDNFRIIKS